MRRAMRLLPCSPHARRSCVVLQQLQQQQQQQQQQAPAAASAAAAMAAAAAAAASAAATKLWPAQLHGFCSTSSSSSRTVQQQQQLRQTNPPAAVARVLDGKAVAAAWSAQLEQQVPQLRQALGRPPGLAVVLVGRRPDSELYVARKEEACQRVGLHCSVLRLSESVSQAKLQDAVRAISANPSIDGILIQLPLPGQLDEEAIMEAIDPRKDVDGFHPLNMGRMLMRGRAPRFVPATPLGVVELLARSCVSVADKTVVILGDSNIVGTPLAALLRDAGAALVTTCHRVSYQEWFEDRSPPFQRAHADVCLPRLPGPAPAAQRPSQQQQQQQQQPPSPQHQHHGSKFQASQLPAICRTADILVVAVGSAELVREAWVKPGAVVVDVGINVVPLLPTEADGSGAAAASDLPQHELQQQQRQQVTSSMQLAQGSSPGADSSSLFSCGSGWRVVGDVAHDEVARVASVLTPVPGGVGPMTIAAVLHNTLQAARYAAGLLTW